MRRRSYVPRAVPHPQAPELDLLLKVDGAEALHHPEHVAAVEVEDVVEEHGVPVEEELVLLEVEVVAEGQPLGRVLAERQDPDPGLGVAEDQVLGDVEDLAPHIDVDDVGLP